VGNARNRARTNNWSFQEYTKLIHPQDLAAFLVGTNQGTHLSSEEDRFSNVCRIIKPDGTIAFIEQAGLVVRNPQGRPIRVIGVAWDVTEQKRAEAALRESEERFRQIAENVGRGLLDSRGRTLRIAVYQPGL
jgi:PAS domain-containing protein